MSMNHNVTIARDAAGKVLEEVRVDPVSGLRESYLYSYDTTAATNLIKVIQRRGPIAGSYSVIRVATYTYYPGVGLPGGNAGDLESARVWDADPDDPMQTAHMLDTTYYRYFLPPETNGYTHGLKMVVGPQAFARLQAAVGNPLGSTTLQDAQVSPFADY